MLWVLPHLTHAVDHQLSIELGVSRQELAGQSKFREPHETYPRTRSSEKTQVEINTRKQQQEGAVMLLLGHFRHSDFPPCIAQHESIEVSQQWN